MDGPGGETGNLSQIARSISESATLKLNETARKLREKGEPVIHLGGGEPRSRTPIDAIVQGNTVQVPKEIDLQYAVASALVGRAIKSQGTPESNTVIGNILDFASTFPQREMGVMLVSDMHRAIGQEMFSVPQFSNWAKVVADVMLYSQ